jgi:hypothetical protein
MTEKIWIGFNGAAISFGPQWGAAYSAQKTSTLSIRYNLCPFLKSL